MKKFRITSKEKISTGKRLRGLINLTGMTDSVFLNNLSLWKDNQPKYNNIKMPIESHISRWVNDRVQMREEKMQMFADFFNVDFEYLDCTQIEPVKEKNKDNEIGIEFDQKFDVTALVKAVKEIEESQKLIELLNYLNYKIDFIQNENSISKDEFQFLFDKTIYTVEYDAPEDMLMILTYPDGSEQEITESELYSLLSDVKKYISFSMELIRKESII